MLRKLVIFSVFAGVSASVPILYEKNPQAVRSLLSGGAAGEPVASPDAAPTVAMVRPEPSEQRTEVLTGRKVRLDSDARGHFNADFRLNGRSEDAMVDTGASVIAINQSTARRIGLRLSASDFTGAVTTANGRAKAAYVMIERVEIGRIAVRNVQAVVLEDKALSGTLIGMSFLSKLKRFQVEDGMLVMEQ
ncbi:TIGR02281 family clan AA aspartic protease [Mesorhizobium sp. CAU 1732]|uniref:TIGR02281 family clan AA aspartic protease n=1 Tax=Mesorhizobium sp. CAU 1732 TaxID=3140358 RepID=UPI003261D468